MDIIKFLDNTIGVEKPRNATRVGLRRKTTSASVKSSNTELQAQIFVTVGQWESSGKKIWPAKAHHRQNDQVKVLLSKDQVPSNGRVQVELKRTSRGKVTLLSILRAFPCVCLSCFSGKHSNLLQCLAPIIEHWLHTCTIVTSPLPAMAGCLAEA